jgi:hypothetical protein
MVHLVEFRALQAIHDLNAVVVELMPDVLGALNLDSTTRDSLVTLTAQGGHPLDMAFALFSEMTKIATDLDRPDRQIAFANAVVMSHLLQTGLPEPLDIAPSLATRLRSFPAEQRSAQF